MFDYFIKLGDALSQFLNVLIFNGDSNHSISGDAWRFKRAWLQRILDFLFILFEKDHCYKAYLHDVKKASKLVEEWNNRHTLPVDLKE
jgi:hypothetical protein